ncbi:MAG: redox-sensing transcriptional repressor Rex [Clostridia bacterium]|nr:redox-sensing transcriptional repressor Rex [Clostridia bacterium]MBR3809294.1 redox-sensing transcriptional repressor Rex [Clostridia bacterium]
MKKNEQVSTPVIKRLPRYHRYLEELKRQGVVRISSKELSARMGLTASQIRQDLNCFGGFGQQGYGYNIEQLYNEIGNILGLSSKFKAVLIGAGNLGHAVATHLRFEDRGFDLIGIFDNNPNVIGQQIGNKTVLDSDILEEFCKEHNPSVAILCIPSEFADTTAKKLVSLGIKGFWNFTQYDIATNYKGIAVENVHLGDSLMTLCYQINNIDNLDEESK